MSTPLRDKLRVWGQDCANAPVIITLRYAAYDGERGAYQMARRLTTSFAALRTWERKVANKRAAIFSGGQYIPVAPFEDVNCYAQHDSAGQCYRVYFIKLDPKNLNDGFEVEGGGESLNLPPMDIPEVVAAPVVKPEAEVVPIVNSTFDPLACSDDDMFGATE